MEDKAVMINLRTPNYHYDGDSHIFFTLYDKSVFEDDPGGRFKITKEEFDQVRDLHIERLKQF